MVLLLAGVVAFSSQLAGQTIAITGGTVYQV